MIARLEAGVTRHALPIGLALLALAAGLLVR